MGRPSGVRNAGYDEARSALARKMREAVVREGARVSLHDLARAADVSIPTLKHYFGDRSGAIAAALRGVRIDAARYIERMAEPGNAGLGESLSELANGLAHAWVHSGVGRLFSAGMSAGLFDATAGVGYLEGVLEPTVHAMEARLTALANRGEVDLDPSDGLAVRTAALAFLSPLLLALIHQHGLNGRACRALDVHAFIREHVSRFVRAYRPDRPLGRS